jgi:broad specificity phosphatase PhoE
MSAAVIAARLVLVRHGETIGNSSIRYYGRTDVALSELGHNQMRAVRAALHDRFGSPRFDLVFASPLTRAREGAAIIAGSTPIIIDEFAEVNFGEFEGLVADEIRDRYPEDFARWNRNRLDPAYAYPGGESRAGFTARVNQGIERMLTFLSAVPQAAAINALVVAHRGVIRTIMQRLAQVEPMIELASIQSLIRTSASGDWRVELLDETAHLASIREYPRPKLLKPLV